MDPMASSPKIQISKINQIPVSQVVGTEGFQPSSPASCLKPMSMTSPPKTPISTNNSIAVSQAVDGEGFQSTPLASRLKTINPMASSPKMHISTNNQVPEIMGSEGFKTPPPASSLLLRLRRTATDNFGSSTYIIASSNEEARTGDPEDLLGKRSKRVGKKRGKYKKKNKNPEIPTDKLPYKKKKLAQELERISFDDHSLPEKEDRDTEEVSDNIIRPLLWDNAIWRPADDLRLISNVQQTCDLKRVHIGVKFSCHFTLEDITKRWQTLLLDKNVSSAAQRAILNMHPLLRKKILSEVLFSDKEEDLLKSVKEVSAGNPCLTIFEKILDDNRDVFYKSRTPKCLFDHWLRLKAVNLLECQKSQEHMERFEEFEMGIDDEMLMATPFDKKVFFEMNKIKRKNITKIKKVEKEVRHLQNILDNILLKGTFMKTETIDHYATLRGEQVQYLMRSPEMTFGVRTQYSFVDADLQLEGSIDQVSRLQGKIVLENRGEFYIHNLGRNNIIVDARPLRPCTKTLIADQTIILIGKLCFTFDVNKPVIAYIQRVYNEKLMRQKNKDLDPSDPSKKNSKFDISQNSSGASTSTFNSSQASKSGLNSSRASSSTINSSVAPGSTLHQSGASASGHNSASTLNSRAASAFNLNQSTASASPLNSSGASAFNLNSSRASSATLNSSRASSTTLNSSKTSASILNSSGASAFNLNQSTASASILNSSGASSATLNSSGASSATLNSSGASAFNLNTSRASASILSSSGASSATLNSSRASSSPLNSSRASSATLNSSRASASPLNSIGASAFTLNQRIASASTFNSSGASAFNLNTSRASASPLNSSGASGVTLNTSRASASPLNSSGASGFTLNQSISSASTFSSSGPSAFNINTSRGSASPLNSSTASASTLNSSGASSATLNSSGASASSPNQSSLLRTLLTQNISMTSSKNA